MEAAEWPSSEQALRVLPETLNDAQPTGGLTDKPDLVLLPDRYDNQLLIFASANTFHLVLPRRAVPHVLRNVR